MSRRSVGAELLQIVDKNLEFAPEKGIFAKLFHCGESVWYRSGQG